MLIQLPFIIDVKGVFGGSKEVRGIIIE